MPSSYAVRVLVTDVRLHGKRFVLVEFWAATALAAVLALIVLVAAIVRGSLGVSTIVSSIVFAGVSSNAAAVVIWVNRHHDAFAGEQRASVLDLARFVGATLLPGALGVALHRGP